MAEADFALTKAAQRFLSAREVVDPSTPLVKRLSSATAFRPGIPDLGSFPVTQFKRSFNALSWTRELLDIPRSWSCDTLRNAIVQRLQQTRGIVCSPDQVLIVPSSHYAVSLVARSVLTPRDDVIVEEPGHANVRSVFVSLGARTVPVDVDDDGIDVSLVARRRAALAYVTPSHQYPIGSVMSLERRYALLNWASDHNAWIIEDDYDCDFNYGVGTQPALQGLDGGRRVLYIGTFSKILGPALQVSYLIAPRPLCNALKAAHTATGGYVSPVLQAALAAFMERGRFTRHVAKMRRVYDERRRFLSSALSKAGLRVRDWSMGLHFIAEFVSPCDAQVSARAADAGVIAAPLSSYFQGRPTRNGLVLGFAETPVAIANTAVEMLVNAF